MADALKTGKGGRGKLFLSQGTWSLQRSARWDDWILIHTIDTGIKDFSEWMLFNLAEDPHETTNLASERPDIVRAVGQEINQFFEGLAGQCPLGDPFKVVRAEGGPYHAKAGGGDWALYLERLENTGRSSHAAWLREHGNSPRPPELAAY